MQVRSIELTSNNAHRPANFLWQSILSRCWAPINENHLVLREVIGVGTTASKGLFFLGRIEMGGGGSGGGSFEFAMLEKY